MPIDRRSLLTYAAALPLSTWKLVFSSIVPRTLPPKTSGAISRPVFPSDRNIRVDLLLWLKFGLVAPPPLLLGGLPCRVTGIAGRLLFSLKQRITFCLFGSVSSRLLGRRALGVGCCLRCKLGLLRSVALLE